MQSAVLAARSIGVVQQAALSACIIYKYLHATEQHFACYPKWRRVVRSIIYASGFLCYAHNVLVKLTFGSNNFVYVICMHFK